MRSPAYFLILGMLTACSSITPGGSKCPKGCVSCRDDGTCGDCTPNVPTCQGPFALACRGDGTLGETLKTCDIEHNEQCMNGDCLTPCDVAAQTHSYIGCDYWPVTTVNAELNPEFKFAVVVANPLAARDVVTNSQATITVMRGMQTIATVQVGAGEVKVIELPWVYELSQNSTLGGNNPVGKETSVVLPDGAYHLVSTLPVSVYQFNPLKFEMAKSATCEDPGDLFGTKCHSFSNDASLLLPTTALQSEYMVAARQTFALKQTIDTLFGKQTYQGTSPGFFAVVGTEDGTQVDVTYSAFTESGADIDAASPGAVVSYTLNRGTVLEIVSKKPQPPWTCEAMANEMPDSATRYDYCDLGRMYDLTGTRIVATKPIAVFGGHSCSFVPYDKWACDHLEEQLLPLGTWGQRVLAVQTEPQTPNEPNIWRVISGSSSNSITFDPPEVHAPATLGAGEFLEFVAKGAFQARGTGRIAVAQFMVGQKYVAGSQVSVGDPSLGLGVPVEQYRTDYDFLTPDTYTKSYVNVIAPAGANITLDPGTNSQATIDQLTAIGSTGMGYKRVQVMPGAHHLVATQPFGITVSGIGLYTSYLYAGGLNLNEVPLQ